MPLENDKLFPELFYALLKDFLGEGDGLMIGGEELLVQTVVLLLLFLQAFAKRTPHKVPGGWES